MTKHISTTAVVLAVCLVWGGLPATGATILSTDFTGRTVSGKTANSITWTTNGVADPGSLTFVPEGPPTNTNLFNTSNAQGHFAPDMNVENESPWNVTIPLTLTAPAMYLDEVVLDWQHFTNSGAYQGPSRNVTWTVTVTGSSSGLVDSETASVSGTSGIKTVPFALPPTLTDSETWDVKLRATGSGNGNNTGLDAVTLNATVLTGPVNTAYRDAVLADGPFAYWRLNEAAGPTADNLGTVGAPLDGTYNNASGFTFRQASLLPSGEDFSLESDGATANGGTEVRIPDSTLLNDGDHDNKTVELWFETDAITTTRQVLYEQGGTTRGINLYLEEVAGVDTLFMGAWNMAESDWGPTFVSTPVSEDTAYHAVFVLDGDPDGNNGTDDGFVRGYLNGVSLGSVGGAGHLRAHGNNNAAMGVTENVRYADGSTQGDGANFAGFLDEVALYNIMLDDPDGDGDLADSRVLAHYQAAGGSVGVIPEPMTMLAVGMGVAGLGRYVRRRRA